MNAKSSTVLAAPCEGLSSSHQQSAQTFEWPIRSSHPLLMREQIASMDLDGYRIMSLSLPICGDGRRRQDVETEQLLLMPLTWNQLFERLHLEMEYSGASEENDVVRFGQIRIDFLAMDVSRSNQPVSLTALEFKVLKFFVSHPNQVISRDDMLNKVWGYENYPCTRTVDNQILKLRQKLEVNARRPAHFRTVHGIGYKFVP